MTVIRTIRVGDNDRRPTEEEVQELVSEIGRRFEDIGVDCYVRADSKSSIRFSECKLTDDYVERYGMNENMSGRGGRYLSYDDWVEVNNTVNGVLDEANVSAVVSSVTHDIRSGRTKYSFRDYIYGSSRWTSRGRGRHGWRLDRGRERLLEHALRREREIEEFLARED